MKSEVVFQLQLRECRPVWTGVLRIRVFLVGQGQCIVLIVVLAESLIADSRSIGFVPVGGRRERLFEVEGIRIGFLQDLWTRFGVVSRSSLHRGR